MSGPNDLQRARFAVGDALRRGDIASAMDLADQAVSAGLEEINLLTLAGQRRMRIGKPDAALGLLVRAREIEPTNIEALNALGLCLAAIGKGREAVAIFDEALAQAPDTGYLHLHKAQTLEEIGAFADARAALEVLIAKKPDSAQALARLAGLTARRGDWAETRDFAERALKVAPIPAAGIALAMADLEEKKFDAAHARLTPLLADRNVTPLNRSIVQGLIGDALEGLGKTDDAFTSYTHSRQTLGTAAAPLFRGKERAVDRVRRIASYFQEAPTAPWVAKPENAAPANIKTHVFLVGFPRSGTTLLEQVLASHGDIQTMEEADALADVIAEFADPPGGLEKFAALDAEGLARCRGLYWERVAAVAGKPQKGVFVDKMPLNTIHLGLIARLFPGAKILFALRDPRDVVLSCFRRRLVMTAHMFEFTKLDTTANFYAAVMELAALYRGKLGQSVLDTRHEDLLADFEGEVRRICAFLGLDWSDAMRGFAAAARERDIKTPSSMQVVRGLSSDGAGQWKRYTAQLAPVLPTLAPWLDRFGYKDS